MVRSRHTSSPCLVREAWRWYEQAGHAGSGLSGRTPSSGVTATAMRISFGNEGYDSHSRWHQINRTARNGFATTELNGRIEPSEPKTRQGPSELHRIAECEPTSICVS